MAQDSDSWRLRGNDDFDKALGSETNPMEFYTSALSCYARAMDQAKTDREYSSAAKNYAKTCATVCDYFKRTPWKKQERLKYTGGALEFYSKAVSRGSSCQATNWIDQVNIALKSTLDDASLLAEEFPTEEKVQVLQSLVKDMVDDKKKRLWLLKAVDILYNEAMRTEDDNKARDLLNDTMKPLERAKSLGGLTAHWENDIDDARRAIRARIEYKRAEALLQDAIMNKNDSDLLLAAIDTFINAIKLAEDSQREVEARAYSQLGSIYEMYFKNDERAKAYYRKCIYIADNILPKSFLQNDWYLKCTEAIQRYQKQAVDDAEEAEYKDKKELLAELKDELEKLKTTAKEGIPSLLVFISKEFPPRGKPMDALSKPELDALDSKGLKRAVMRMVARYHPDKQSGQDKKWRVLCEEITKHFNRMMENMKLTQ